jgi:putative nucleotidyltransferase with HDIG domain
VRDWDFAVGRDALALARAVADDLRGAFYALDKTRDTGRALVCRGDDATVVLDFAGLRGPDIRTDLRERDFTVNALAIDVRGRLIDATGGLADLQRRHIRVTGETAFADDPLRTLRAVRVARELHFAIEPTTLDLIHRSAPLLAHVSPERRRDELVRLVSLPEAGGALQDCQGLGLLGRMIPELDGLDGQPQTPPHRFDAWQHTTVVVDTAQNVIETLRGQTRSAGLADAPDAGWDGLKEMLGPYAGRLNDLMSMRVSGGILRCQVLKLAALLHDVGKAETGDRDESGRIHFYDHGPAGARIARERLVALRFSHEVVDRVGAMVVGHLRPAHLARADRVTGRAAYRYFRALGETGVDVVLLSLADHLATWGPNLQSGRWERRLETGQALLAAYLDHHDERVAPPPLVTGRDLMSDLHLSPGPALGRILERVREAQAAGEVGSRDEALDLAARAAQSLTDDSS